jgi:septum formation topological specificity factor MinE
MGGGGGQERAGGEEVEEETEVDILLARKRREANDRYFQRVNQGVLDVVSKLEEVAIAMREVELESKELWGDDNESVSGSAKT